MMRRREWGDLPVVVGGVLEAWSGIASIDEQLYTNARNPLLYGHLLIRTPSKQFKPRNKMNIETFFFF